MLEHGDFATQLSVYHHGIWVLVEDIVRKADYLTDIYIQDKDTGLLDKIISLLSLAESLANTTACISDEANLTYQSIVDTLAVMRTLALQKVGSGLLVSSPVGWDLEEN